MNERIKKLRKHLELSGEEFGNRIGIKKAAISKIENGLVGLSESNIKALSREFGVNENWLKYGEGEMFLKSDILDDLAKLHVDILKNETSFKSKLISVLARMPEKDWKVLENFAYRLFKELEEKN